MLAGVQTNLYMVFMDTAWRNLKSNGRDRASSSRESLHRPEGWSTPCDSAYEPTCADIGSSSTNCSLFEDVGIHGPLRRARLRPRRDAISFLQMSSSVHPDTVDRSLRARWSEMVPAEHPAPGGRMGSSAHIGTALVTVTEDVLADWARLFDEPGTPADRGSAAAAGDHG